MKSKTENALILKAFAEMAFLPLAMSFVEKGTMGLGLQSAEAMALTLASEEVFAYLSRSAAAGQPVEIRCLPGGYYVCVEFSLPGREFHMRAFNLTSRVSLEDETSLEEMGLFLASRFVDRFEVRGESGRRLRLALIKEKSYPPLPEGDPLPARALEHFTVRPAEPEEIKFLVRLVAERYPGPLVPHAFRYPGKVVDMVATGEYCVELAADAAGHIGGGIVWYWRGLKTVEFFGPFLFSQPPQSPMVASLLDACIGRIARTPAVGLFNWRPTPELPTEYFEPLGDVAVFDAAGEARRQTAYFRQMQEDPGTAVWCHPQLEAFLEEVYDRLFLPREIRAVHNQGETRNPWSVLSAQFDRPQNLVNLRPIRAGADMKENLINHLHLFESERIRSQFFEIDLAHAWQCDFIPVLLDNDFAPRLVLPYAGQSDVVVFQKSGAAG